MEAEGARRWERVCYMHLKVILYEGVFVVSQFSGFCHYSVCLIFGHYGVVDDADALPCTFLLPASISTFLIKLLPCLLALLLIYSHC